MKVEIRKLSVVLSIILNVAGCNQGNSAPQIQCGGAIGFVCPSKMYCYLGEKCGGLDAEGVCKPRPKKCTNEIIDVCGCDDKTYSNECYASLKGVSVKHSGKCE
jgi:hypothetical protein